MLVYLPLASKARFGLCHSLIPPMRIGMYKGFAWASYINICSFQKNAEIPIFFEKNFSFLKKQNEHVTPVTA